MKTLRIIQTLAKIGKIISKIIFICSLVGGIGCIVGIISLAAIPEGLKIGGVTLHAMIEKSAGISMETYYAAMAVGVIFCAGEAVLARIAERYFKNELNVGTPFTFEGAKELLRLGICAVCIPVGTAILSAIVFQIMKACFANVSDFSMSDSVSFGLGVAMIVTSLLCKYGAELSQSGSAQADRPEA